MQQNEPLGITKVALDAMGGDNAPGEIVKGAVDAVVARPDIKVRRAAGNCKTGACKVYIPGRTD